VAGVVLGIRAAAGLLALVTSMLGASAGANPILVALDIARIGARDRSSEAEVKALAARPSTR
jgi:hypothetical protein